MEIHIPSDFFSLVIFLAVIAGLLILASGSLIGRACERRALEKAGKMLPIVDGFVLEPAHAAVFLRDNPSMTTLRDIDHAQWLTGRDSASLKELRAAVQKQLAAMTLRHPGKLFVFRPVRDRPWEES